MTFDEQEIEGSSVEDAIRRAVKKFGVTKDKLDIKVICEENRGLFGMPGSKSAKIRVSVKK